MKNQIYLLLLFLSIGASLRAQDLYVGSNTSGETTNFSSGTNAYGYTYVGYNAGADSNNLNVYNPGTLLTNANDLNVGYSGAGNTMTLSDGGIVANYNGYIGYTNTSSNNSVLVAGSNSSWFNSANLNVGFYGSSNSLIVSNDGFVTSLAGIVGYETNSIGNLVQVTGTNAAWSADTNSMTIGNYGASNTLIISNGGSVTNGNGILGFNDSSSGNIIQVVGTNSIWNNLNDLTVGNYGASNTLIISNGGTAISGGYSTIGFQTNSTGNLVQLTGSNSAWNNATNLVVGNYGSSNTVVASNGSTFFCAGDTLLAFDQVSSNNKIIVTGSNTLWINQGDVYVGQAGSGNTMVVSNGANVYDSTLFIGSQTTSSNNSVIITGSTWTNGYRLKVGEGGSGNMLIVSNGSSVNAGAFFQVGDGYYANNNSTIVTGSNSSLVVAYNAVIGQWNSGNSLVISNGGTVTVTQNVYASGVGYDGDATSTNNSIFITGSGSSMTAPTFWVGYGSAESFLTISNGGSLSSLYGYIGSGGGSNATVAITGSNSVWSNNQVLTIGGFVDGTTNNLDDGSSGSALVTVADRASLIAGSNVCIGSGSNTTGTLNIGTYGASDAAGSLITPKITFGPGSGTLNFNQSNTLTITSTIVGNGTVQQLGSGLTILSGNNTYGGTTLITNGTLIAGSTTALGSSTALLTGHGVLEVETPSLNLPNLNWEDTNAQIMIQTPGSTILNVTSNLTATGPTNYFQLGGIDNNVNLIATIGTNSTYNDFAIAGVTNGSIIMQTNGALVKIYEYVGTNSSLNVTGTETISSNVSVVNVSYNTNSTLVIAAGGTLEAIGDYTSTNSGTLEYVFTSTAAAPRLIIDGSCILGGIFTALFANGKPNYGDKYRFMTAGSISGQFSSIQICDGLVAIPDPTLRGDILCIGDPEEDLLIAPASYTQVALNQNQYNVASALNSFIPATSGSGDEYTVKIALDSLTASQYPNAFNQISPALYTSLATIAFNSAVAQYNEMVQRLGNIRIAGVGFSTMGMNESPILDDSKNPKSHDKDILIPAADNHWGFFVDGNGIFANVNINNQLPGYSAEGGGVTIGADYKWNQKFSTGVYFGYEGFQSKQSGGNYISDNGSRFGLFGTYQEGGLFVNGIVGGDSHSYLVNRGIQFSTINRIASSAPTAGEFDSMLATGYDVKRGNFTFGPITSLQYTYFGLQPFTESGAQSLDLSVQNANANSMVYSLGSHCFYTWQASKNILVIPQINLAWQHEFLQNPYALNSSFSNGAAFTYNSTTPLRDSLYTGVGATINFEKKYDLSFFYNASAANPSIMSQNFFASLGMRF